MESAGHNAGILALDIYFPTTFVSQQKLEQFDGVSSGKYTVGLGQNNMACVGDDEDVCSIALTVVSSLMSKYSIPYQKIGRLEVGTESLVDKCKSVKTSIMQLFENNNNSHIQGVDSVNACYGGTAALMNAVNWISSDYWDGYSLAIVVTVDIAVYAPGPARATGGVGGIAMLIGRDAPLHIEPRLEGIYTQNAYDFYKPVALSTEYPIVNGRYSIDAYLLALHHSYQQFKKAYKKKYHHRFCVHCADYLAFHCPYSKLVQKGFAYLLLDDFIDSQEEIDENDKEEKHCIICAQHSQDAQPFKQAALQLHTHREKNYYDKELEDKFLKLSNSDFTAKVLPSLLIAKEVGNMYCGSLYAGLLSLVNTIHPKHLIGKRILLFSYGSGLVASMFSIYVRGTEEELQSILQKVNLAEKFSQRIEVTPLEFTQLLNLREKMYVSHNYTPEHTQHQIPNSTYYLQKIDENYQRFYNKKE